MSFKFRAFAWLSYCVPLALLLIPLVLRAQVPPPDIITTIAGSGFSGGYSGDGGPATNALLSKPRGLAIAPDGTIYFSDLDNYRIRRITPDGIITTIAGNGTWGDSGDGGPATSAQISSVLSIALDHSRDVLYIADIDNNRVRQVNLGTGIIDNFAGLGLFGFGFDGDGGPAQFASLAFIEGVAVDTSGNVYIADTGNTRVRKVDSSTGIINTIAGSNSGTTAGDGGPATLASFTAPIRIAVDVPGNVFVLDQSDHCRVRRIDAGTGIITTVAGGGTILPGRGQATETMLPAGSDIAVDDIGGLFISASNQIYYVDLYSGTFLIVAGSGGFGFSGDGGRAVDATFSIMEGVIADYWGRIIVSDTLNSRLRSFTPAYPPFIYDQPKSRTNAVGTTATFLVGGGSQTSSGLTFQWRKDGTNLVNGGNILATYALLKITNVQLSDAGGYSVVITNVAGSVTSLVATLTVTSAVPPAITAQPESRTNTVGTSATFSVGVEGTPPFTYQWRFNNADIPGATDFEYSLGSVQITNAGDYSVVVTNVAGSVTSAVASLTVLTPASPPSITAQPNNLTNFVGTSATLSVGIEGTPPFTYQWRFNNAEIAGATDSEYSLASVQTTNAGEYSIVVTNVAGSVTSAVATLTVLVPPTNAVVELIDASQAWKCFPGQSAAPTGVWTDPLYNDSGWISGAQLFYIEMDPLSNSEGFVKITEPVAYSSTRPYQTYYFRTMFHYNGSLTDVVLTATLMLDDGAVVYLNGFEAARVRMPAGAVAFNTLANTNVGNAAVETVNIPADHLVLGDNVIAVEVHQSTLQTGPAPGSDMVWGMKLATLAITTQPQSQVAAVGDSASFTVAAAGAGPLSYQWRFNGTNLSGATDTDYALLSAQSTNAGNYSVVVSSLAGSVTSAVATLTVTSAVPPFITTQPHNQTNFPGTGAAFSVVATGTGPLFYQWRFNGTDILGATNANYTLSSAQIMSAGSYSVVVTNVAGSVTSAVATLTVIVPDDNSVPLVSANQVWKYSSSGSAAPANDGSGHVWSQPGYNDSSWTTAGQLLYIETAALANPEGFVKTTALPGITTTRPYQTYYFRSSFNYEGPLMGGVMKATLMLDDGAVIYLNGFEVARVRMPPGSITFNTLANATVGDAVVETLNIPAEHLVSGNNVIAVEVHQSVNQSGASPSSDIVWGMKLETATVDADGNGLPDAWEQQYFGHNGVDLNADADNDGMSNSREYLSGTNPTNALSFFRLTSASPTNNDVRVDWTTVGGHGYVLQAALTAGGLLTNFVDVGPIIYVDSTAEGTTNYVHIGAATNAAAGCYRVRLAL